MAPKGVSAIVAGSDFQFSGDVSVLHEFNGNLYLGDLANIEAGTSIRFGLGTCVNQTIHLQVLQNGSSVLSLSQYWSGTPGSANLKIVRSSGTYSFYANDQLIWQDQLTGLVNTALYAAVAEEITSGPSGFRSQIAVDNLALTE